MLGLLKLIPTPYKIGAIVVLAASLWLHGFTKGNARASRTIAAYVAKANTSENTLFRKQAATDINVLWTYAAKTDTIRVRTTKNVEVSKDVPGPVVFVHDTVTRVELPLGWLSVHNASARADNADSASAVNGTASGVTPNDALGLVVQNYGVCQENAVRLKSLQDWISQTRLNVDSVNAAAKKRK
jgi:hypothetical protein